MSAAAEAGAALPLLWEVIVILAETTNDLVVDAQRLAPAPGAQQIADIAADLSALARAAEILAKLRDAG